MKFRFPYTSPIIFLFMNGNSGGINPQPLGKSDSTDAILPRTYFVIIWTHRLQSLLLSLCTVQQFGVLNHKQMDLVALFLLMLLWPLLSNQEDSRAPNPDTSGLKQHGSLEFLLIQVDCINNCKVHLENSIWKSVFPAIYK